MRAKKSLGQNFLRDKGILKKIADFAQIEKEDTVVEVGPGEGTLTELLLERAEKVIAVEKDERMVDFLREKFKKETKEGELEVFEGDALELPDEFFSIFSEGKSAKREKNSSGSDSYKLVGNIPYYITGALFKKVLESANPPESITFVVQKEVAERIMAKDGKESILSISIKAYGEPEFGGIIKAGSFSPKPKVDSAIISVRNISKKRFNTAPSPHPLPLGEGAGGEAALSDSKKLENRFFEILRAGFAHKRKLLIKNLNKFGESPKIKGVFKKCGIPEKARAENLSTQDWVCLAKEFSPQK